MFFSKYKHFGYVYNDTHLNDCPLNIKKYLNDIIQKAPYMTTKAIESTIVKFVDTVALHELLIEEFKKYPQ